MQMLVGGKFLRRRSPLAIVIYAVAVFALLYGAFNVVGGLHAKTLLGSLGGNAGSDMVNRQLWWGGGWAVGGIALLCVTFLVNDPAIQAEAKSSKTHVAAAAVGALFLAALFLIFKFL